MRSLAALVLLLGIALCAVAQKATVPTGERSPAETLRFDGTWDATVACPDVWEAGQRAKGYTLRFSVEVRDGVLHGQHGSANAPSWLLLEGHIRADGAADIAARGLTGDPDYSVGQVVRSTPYGYSVKAQFSETGGSGQRMEGRECELSFAKR
jgi:hypothetical protein